MVTILMRKANNGIFARRTIGTTDLKFGIYMQLLSGSNMGFVPLGHIFSFPYVILLITKIGISANTLESSDLDQ